MNSAVSTTKNSPRILQAKSKTSQVSTHNKSHSSVGPGSQAQNQKNAMADKQRELHNKSHSTNLSFK